MSLAGIESTKKKKGICSMRSVGNREPVMDEKLNSDMDMKEWSKQREKLYRETSRGA